MSEKKNGYDVLFTWPHSPEVQKLLEQRERLGVPPNHYIGNDHDNVFKKLKYFTVTSGSLAAAAAAFHLVYVEPPFTYMHAYETMLRIIAPPVAMGAVYASTVKVVADIRKRDDPFNHAIAGFAAGAVWGARTRSQWKGFVVGSFIALAGALFKLENKYDWRWFRGMYVPKHPDEPPVFAQERFGFFHYNRALHPFKAVQELESEESAKIP